VSLQSEAKVGMLIDAWEFWKWQSQVRRPHKEARSGSEETEAL